MSVHEECGVFGAIAKSNVSMGNLVYYGLYALQHRGQESCGIVVNDDGVFTSHKDLGLVGEVFGGGVLDSLPSGKIAVGHVRYGTTGGNNRNNCQPIEVNHQKGRLALAHNGNGIRCVGKYVYDKGYTDKTILKIETLSGIKTLQLSVAGGKVNYVTVDMGKSAAQEKQDLEIDGQTVSLIPVSVGNPHAVIFVEDIQKAPLTTLGPVLEHHSFFPDGVNVEFVQVISKNELRMRVWERGSGVTWACGTGACASVTAAISQGYCDCNSDVSVILDGGTLHITVDSDNTVTMRGPATTVYEGETEL